MSYCYIILVGKKAKFRIGLLQVKRANSTFDVKKLYDSTVQLTSIFEFGIVSFLGKALTIVWMYFGLFIPQHMRF